MDPADREIRNLRIKDFIDMDTESTALKKKLAQIEANGAPDTESTALEKKLEQIKANGVPMNETNGVKAVVGLVTPLYPLKTIKHEYHFKVLIIGDSGTGKTSIINRYANQKFLNNYKATIGVDFALKVIRWSEDTVVRIKIWDIAGADRYRNMTRVYYKEATGALVVFDVNQPPTLAGALKWKELLDQRVTLRDESNVPAILVGNKCDLPKRGIVEQEHEMDDYAWRLNFIGWFLTSAKENIGLDKAFSVLISRMIADHKRFSEEKKENKATKLMFWKLPKNNRCC